MALLSVGLFANGDFVNGDFGKKKHGVWGFEKIMKIIGGGGLDEKKIIGGGV